MNKNSGKGAAAGTHQGGQGGQQPGQPKQGNMPGAGYPSTTGNPSGGGRTNTPPKK